MKFSSLVVQHGRAALAIAVFAAHGAAQAADVRVLSAGAMQPVIEILSPHFERATGHRLVVKYGTGPRVLKWIESGEAFDVAIANPGSIDPLVRSGRIVPGSRVQVGRIGLGIGVRAGARKPGVGSSAEFRQALLDAGSVAYIGAGASGPLFVGMLEKLGIGDAMKGKLRPAGIPQNIAAVASGEVDMLVMPIPLIVAASGVDLVGAVPAEYQDYIVLIAGIATNAAQGPAGGALIKHLLSSEADAVFRSKGFDHTASASGPTAQ
jgi:molybdate transport system substrate-binding protein